MIKHLIIDWGNTLMRDFPENEGPMCDWEHIELMGSVVETLAYLSKKYTLSVATNAGISDTIMMRKALHRAKIEQFFTNFYSSKDLGYAKPDPRFFSSVCQLSGYELFESAMIGNDYRKDIQGAAKNKIKTVLFNHENYEGDMSDAEIVISDFSELCRFF